METNMPERKYSVAEIDRMRDAVHTLCTPVGVGHRPVEVEERLRTYMLNGTDPEELEDAASERRNQYYLGAQFPNLK